MTRKKWNRLKRQYPAVLAPFAFWDGLSDEDRRCLKDRWSKGEVIAKLTEHWIANGPFPPRLRVPVKGQPLTNPDGR